MIALAVVAAMAPAVALAQRDAQPRPRESQADQYEITSGLSAAMRYLTLDPDRALSILRDLDARFPGRERVLTRLGYVLQATGEADSAAACYRSALAVNPRSLEAGKSLAILFLGKDRDREAAEVFDRLLDANGHSMSAYRAVGTALREVGRYDEALDLYRKGRERGAKHHVLTLEIADLLETVGDPRGAMDEYLRYVGDAGRNYRFAKGKILDLMRGLDEAKQQELVDDLEARIASKRGNRFVMLDVLAAHLVERGMLESALEKSLQADEEGPSDGSTLVSLAERILVQAQVKPRSERKRHLQLGIRALDAFATNHPRAPGTDRAKFMLASIYVQFGSGEVPEVTPGERVDFLEQAVAEYADLSRSYPNSDYAERAYLERGDVLLRKLKRPDDALEAYRSGSVNSRGLTDMFAARIGDVYLGLGRFDDAEDYFTNLIESGFPELAQAGTYYTGLRLCLAGEYDAARDTLTYLAEQVPESPYTNDAIETAWIIEEGLQFESKSLGTFFEALQADMVGDTATAVARLETIVAQPVYETLRPRALFRLGRTLYHTGDLDRAVAALTRFMKEYPEEDMRPDVQRQIAAVYEFGYERYDRALAEYEDVLLNYPDYAFLDEVRKDVRRLRYIVHGEEYEN